MSLDDATLVAYVDGELDCEAVHAVEENLMRDPEVRAKVDAMRDIAALTRATLNSVVHESVPDRLVRALRSVSKPSTPPPTPRWQWWRRAGPGMAFAASTAILVVGLGGGYFMGLDQIHQKSASVVALESQDQNLRAAAFQDALEFKASGSPATWTNPDAGTHGKITPVRTFKDKQGMFCREFQEITVIDRFESTTFGVACRRPEAGWHTKFRLIPAVDKDRGI